MAASRASFRKVQQLVVLVSPRDTHTHTRICTYLQTDRQTDTQKDTHTHTTEAAIMAESLSFLRWIKTFA